jgi:hypothetical protein
MRYVVRAAVVLSIVVLALGCGAKKSYKFVPVSGKVLLDDKPLPNANIRFQPAEEHGRLDEPMPESYGTTDEDGRYTLKPLGEYEGASGAVPGNYLVQVSVGSAATRKESDPKISANSVSMTVPAEGSSSLDIKLYSKAGAGGAAGQKAGGAAGKKY